ncbi:MAG TPA: FtsX-like permease family protein, partial [Bryobacteraceae bacterium]|nr:FtsX-like permease family protein [Bryobacteraceae bacterium]
SIDRRVLGFTLILCLGSSILFAIGPALALCRANVQNAFKEGARGFSLGGSGLRLRHLLIASELAFAVILLTGAGLMVKSFWKMYTNPPGFAPENTLVMKVALSGPQYAAKARKIAYFTELSHRFESMPGVRAFGIANFEDYIVQSKNNAIPPLVDHFRVSLVSANYFQAIGMRLLKGRWLTATDPSDAVIINETMARRVFGAQDPIGRKLDQHRAGPGGGPVVGVAANLKYEKLDADPGPELFQLYMRNLGEGNTTMTVIVRLAGDPLGLAPALRKSISSIDPAQPVYDIENLEQALSASISARRFEFFLLCTFAAAALLMALIGVYGVIAYSVTQRTREIGIRMALGAQRRTVVRVIVAQGLWMGLCGIAAGLLAAYGLTRLMTSLLYGVAPNDPLTFAAAGVVLAATVLLASWPPALKAALIDPLVALRHE